MKTWLIICEQQYSENTAEYGFCDYPDRIAYILMAIEAETARKAQNIAKKVFPRLRFGGMFGARAISVDDQYAHLYLRPADKRLSVQQQQLHDDALANVTEAGDE